MGDKPQGVDSFAPPEIARKVEQVGVSKARADSLTLLVLAILAGAFISLGALFYTVVITDTGFGWSMTRMLGGLSFCLGLILVVVAGAELFTGNNLIAMAWASGHIKFEDVFRNWAIVYFGNVVGALGTVLLVYWADIGSLRGDFVAATAVRIAEGKLALGMGEAFTRGILCNTLVCLAVWLAMGGRTVVDKIFAILFPITAFVAIGLEHSIANWYFLPYGHLVSADGLDFGGMAANLAVVSLGNIVGGSLMVAGVYWFAYLRGSSED